jgi:hypothetical protein
MRYASYRSRRHHSALLSSCGQLFTWGANTTSRLGLPHIKSCVPVMRWPRCRYAGFVASILCLCRPVVGAPTHVEFFRDRGISRAVCGDFHMAALVDGVRLYAVLRRCRFGCELRLGLCRLYILGVCRLMVKLAWASASASERRRPSPACKRTLGLLLT